MTHGPHRQFYDVVVIGYGYAGAVSAISAADAGARVLLLEKAETPGGISICSAGGLRIADDADAAFAYLHRTNAGKTPDDVLRALADGMTGLAPRLRALAEPVGADVAVRGSPGNYPFPGNETFGFAYVENVADFDPAEAYPYVRGARQGALLFRVLEANVEARSGTIEVALGRPASRLHRDSGGVTGVALAGGSRIGAGAVILAAGGFEADPAMQAQYWPGGPALNAAYRHNTGDGIRMAQQVGADLWHMWHYHGSYGYALPDRSYPFGVRVKRLPDWQPGPDGGSATELPKMAWILLDRAGRRFMNEYEPYVQDTGARPLGAYDPSKQSMPRSPAWLLTDEPGRQLYPLGKPTRNDGAVAYDWSNDNSREIESGLFARLETVDALADHLGVSAAAIGANLERWNKACADRDDPDFGRPAGSFHPIADPPYYAAKVHPIVSNTQGGPRHDAHQRVLDPFGEPIPGLFAAGECGSAFGHLYMSGGNLAECFIGGNIAGANAAALCRTSLRRQA